MIYNEKPYNLTNCVLPNNPQRLHNPRSRHSGRNKNHPDENRRQHHTDRWMLIFLRSSSV